MPPSPPPAPPPSPAQPGLIIARQPLAAGLYIVATPIGHLRDISLRALDVLANAELVLCEDTRRSRKLFAAYGLAVRCLSYHEHNAAARRPQILARLAKGAALALVSDAGTPLISDPGYALVAQARAAGHRVVPVPGASAPLAALAAAGLPTDRFSFVGFLPPKAAARARTLSEFAALPHTLVAFERASRVRAALAAIATAMPQRDLVLASELTKWHERFWRGRAADLLEALPPEPLKGEWVLLFAPAPAPAQDPKAEPEKSAEQWLAQELQHHSVRDAVARAAAQFGQSRQTLYRTALRLSRKRETS